MRFWPSRNKVQCHTKVFWSIFVFHLKVLEGSLRLQIVACAIEVRSFALAAFISIWSGMLAIRDGLPWLKAVLTMPACTVLWQECM